MKRKGAFMGRARVGNGEMAKGRHERIAAETGYTAFRGLSLNSEESFRSGV